MAEVHTKFDRRMGSERTLRKYNFIENIMAGSSSQVSPLDMEGQVEEDKDDDDDHIILEIEEHRELDVSQIVYPGNSSALKWSRP
ncbi:hypothetical protein HID58_038153 [Brassica napus]|uniref:Uncharacterized protein n=1 Tax=Brassica napus TaxID=3708 RepID=A0ABQ8BNA9_BRANA|nr:hypothetical protein HID58_038153 [Brassica napus]